MSFYLKTKCYLILKDKSILSKVFCCLGELKLAEMNVAKSKLNGQHINEKKTLSSKLQY